MRLSSRPIRRIAASAAHLLNRIVGTGNDFPMRSFDAAAAGARWSDKPSAGRINPEVLWSAARIRSRANYFARNNVHAANAIEAFRSNVVGTGIKAASRHPDPVKRRAIQSVFDAWMSECDADGILDFGGLQSVIVAEMVSSGECFAHLIGGPAGLKLRLLDAELVDEAHTTPAPPGNPYTVAGIQFAPDGRRLGYWVRPINPAQLYASAFYPPVFVPESDIAHVFRPIGAGQIRGVSWLAPVLMNLHELDQLRDAQLVRQKVAAMFSAIAVDLNGTVGGNPFDGETKGSILETGLEPGTLKLLPPGLDVRFATPNEASESVPFIKSELRAVAAGLGLPDHLFTGDLSQVNYSSIRASLIEFRRRITAIQRQTLIHQFCRPVYRRVVTLAVLNGQLDAPDFETNLSDYLAVSWHAPAQEWVDPLKDAEADNLAIAAGLKSRREVVAEQGRDIDELDEEIAADRAREKALGLVFEPATAVTYRPTETVQD